MKLKVGDIVKVKGSAGSQGIGYIYRIDLDKIWPVHVRFSLSETGVFAEDELEKA